MARIRLNLRNLTVTEKLAKGRHIVTSMANNPRFPAPTPALAEVTAALDELAQANALVQSAKSEIATRVTAQDNATVKVEQILTHYFRRRMRWSNNTLMVQFPYFSPAVKLRGAHLVMQYEQSRH